MVDLLNQKIDPASVWDGLFLTAGELLMRQPGIVGVHCVTSANALYFAYRASGNDETRRFVTLQCAAFLPMFRKFMLGRGKVGDLRIDTLEKWQSDAKKDVPAAVEEVFAEVGKDRLGAARRTLALLEKDPLRVHPLMAAARRLIFTKGNDSHDYKFSSAALEDYFHVTPRWRANYAAASTFWLHGSAEEDNEVIRRTRAALAKS